MDDKVITKICERIPNQVYFWAVDYAIGDIKTVDARLSANEKQSIIAALDGYCKQEDWELGACDPHIPNHELTLII
ncbi:hypothetical protein KXW36_009210, partial [Aspergillus fumigatus]